MIALIAACDRHRLIGIQFILSQFTHFALLSIEMAQTRCHGTARTPGNS